MNILGIKNILNRKFRGANLDDVQGIFNFSIFGEAASNLTSKIDPMETIRHGIVDVFDGIYDYASPIDLKGKKIADIRPQVNRASDHNVSQTFLEDFDRDKEDLKFSVEFKDGIKFIRYRDSVGNSIVVDDVKDENWEAGGGASNISIDTILYSEAGASLRVDLGALGGYVENESLISLDLSQHKNKSSFFRWIYFPDSSIVTSVTLLVGSDSSNYFTITGQIHLGTIRNGWNLYRFDWNGGVETGSADTETITYERLAFVTTSADTDIRIGRLSSKLPKPEEFIYYSDALFRPVSGSTWLTIPTADTDIVNLENEALNIFIYECCTVIASDLQEYNDMEKFRQKLDGLPNAPGLYDDYKRNKPSEEIRTQSSWYEVRPIRHGGGSNFRN